MIQWFRDLCRYRQDQRILEMQSRIDEKDRMIGVLKAEVDSLAGVIARDRARVAAETARFNREQADCEGFTNERRAGEGIQ